MLSKEEITKIATLARIELIENEVEKFQNELTAILDYVDALKQVDVDGVEEVSQVTGLENVMRPDEPAVSEHPELIFDNAPETKDRFFKVKAIL